MRKFWYACFSVIEVWGNPNTPIREYKFYTLFSNNIVSVALRYILSILHVGKMQETIYQMSHFQRATVLAQ